MTKTNLMVGTVAVVGLILAVGTLLVIRRHDSYSMATVEKMVATGDVSGAAQEVTKGGFEHLSSLKAIKRFAVLVLRRGLKERDPYERCNAAAALAESGENTGMSVLRAAFDAPEPTVKMAAVDGLSEVNDDESRALLKGLYTTWAAPEHQVDQRVVLGALARTRDPEVVGLLMKAANSGDRITRLTAIRGLSKSGNRKVAIQVRELLSIHHPGGLDRFECGRSMTDGCKLEPMGFPDSLDRAEIGRALILLGDKSGIEVVNVALHNRMRPEVRAIAALALGDAHDPAQVPALQKTMTDGDADVRLAAAMALTHYGDGPAVAYLIAAIKHDDGLTRQHIGELLDGIDFQNGRPVVLAAISSPDDNLSMSATRAIGLLGGENEIGVLVERLRVIKDPIERADIAWALGRIGRPACIPELMAMVGETDHEVRYTAADALSRTAIRLLGTKAVPLADQNPDQNI